MTAGAVAVLIRKERDAVRAYREAGATTPERAVAPESIGVHPRLAVHRLISRGVLRETTPGVYYLDEPSWEALQRMRRRVSTVAIIIAIALAIVLLTMGVTTHHP